MTRALSYQEDSPFTIRVDCYAGYRGEETPRRLTVGKRRINVVTVLDRWLAPDHRYFKLIADDDGLYIIRHDPHQDLWQMVCFKAGPVHSPLPHFSRADHPAGTC